MRTGERRMPIIRDLAEVSKRPGLSLFEKNQITMRPNQYRVNGATLNHFDLGHWALPSLRLAGVIKGRRPKEDRKAAPVQLTLSI
jgi:hypothetical protein